MGIALSKREHEFCPRRVGKQRWDDALQSPTVCTEESTLPPSPVRTGLNSFRRKKESTKKSSIDVTSSDVSVSSAQGSHRRGISHQSLQDNEVAEMNLLPRRDSDPGAPASRNRSPTIPVVRRSRPLSFAPNGGVASSPDAEADEYLVQMYDSRTWEMFRRITDHRKNSNYSYTPTPVESEYNKENTSEWENLNHDYMDNSDGQHEMIFLFDFD